MEQILLLDKESITPNVGLMAAYGTRFDGQRQYYRGLPPHEKRAYEEAVVALCRMDDVAKATIGLYICSELADLFPEDWKNRVADLVRSLIEQGLPLAYHGAISHAVIRLIRAFRIEPLLPFVHDYLRRLTAVFKEGGIPRTEFRTMLHELSRTLITASPDDFWREFASFHQDRALMRIVRKDFFDLTYFWASTGVQLYGLDWLRKLAIVCTTIADQSIKRVAYRAIREHARYLASVSRQGIEVAEFLKWLEVTLGPHDNG